MAGGMVRGPDGFMRIEPALPAQAFKTYQIAAPLSTHWRTASCEEVRCDAYLHGWALAVDESTELGQRQADYIRHDRSRRFQEARTAPGLTQFTYPPGQHGFAPQHEHRVRLEREERFLITGGDWRGNPLGTPRTELPVQSWADDFGEHQERLADRLAQG